jgi:mono/diheme cytochrome c family protein
MRGFILGVIITLVVLFGGLLLFLKLGMVDVRAAQPISGVENTLANMAMDASVEHRAPHLDNPIQPTDDNLMTGAMLYEKNCSLCHGSAADKGHTSPMAQAFYPHVPQVVRRIPGDEDWHLFYVTKWGIRDTGMPAWEKTMKDDDIWRVISFIKHSDKLSPTVQEMWQTYATPSGVAPPNSTNPQSKTPPNKSGADNRGGGTQKKGGVTF